MTTDTKLYWHTPIAGKSLANASTLFAHWVRTEFKDIPEEAQLTLMWRAWLESYKVSGRIVKKGAAFIYQPNKP